MATAQTQRRIRGTRSFLAVAAAGTIALAGQSALAQGESARTTNPDPTTPGPHSVASAFYDLGDKAFHVPGFHSTPEAEMSRSGDSGDSGGSGDSGNGAPLADIELTGVVHYPKDLGGGQHPLVIMSHGLWNSCADREAGNTWESSFEKLYGPDPVQDPAERKQLEKALDKASGSMYEWPCESGVDPIPSHRGFDYLGKHLASHGIIAVSISANGVNNGEGGQVQDRARAALINKHLSMWQRLVTTGKGPLAGKFADTATGNPVDVEFTNRIDLSRVATMGHSRGGRGTMYHASERHRDALPSQVRLRAVIPMEPASYYTPDGGPDPNYQVYDTPFLAVGGTCDVGVGGVIDDYFRHSRGSNSAPIHQLILHGANHNYFNTQWSPSSGQVMSHDDVHEHRLVQEGEQLPPPGRCVPIGEENTVPQLTERDQRHAGLAYMTAFLLRHLEGRTEFDPMLTGKEFPLKDIAKIGVKFEPPAK